MFRISTRLRAVPVVVALALIGGVACQSAPVEPTSPAADVTALTNARVIDGTGRTPLEQATVIISDGAIEAVGAASTLAVPDGATVIDMTGKTIMPGMINAHGHVQRGHDASIPVREDLVQRLETYASYGVTTVVSLGAIPEGELMQITLRDEQDGVELDHSRVYTSGMSINRVPNEAGGGMRPINTPDDARAAVDRVADLGVDVIKLHVDNPPARMSDDTLGALIEQAEARDLNAVAHLWFLADAKVAVERGIDAIGHSVRDVDVDEELITAMRESNVGYIPTLTRELAVFVYETTPTFLSDPFFLRGISVYQDQVDVVTMPEYQERLQNDPAVQSIKQALVQAQTNLKLLADGGVTIGFGTDGGVPNANTFGRWEGYFEHVELELMVEAGLSPLQAITAATGGSARVSHLDALGTIEPGKTADLLVLDANPLEDILNTRQINSVWVGGNQLGTN